MQEHDAINPDSQTNTGRYVEHELLFDCWQGHEGIITQTYSPRHIQPITQNTDKSLVDSELTVEM